MTLTWDVLKWWSSMIGQLPTTININMRCIEIKDFLNQATVLLRLTLTWDVLNCFGKTEATTSKED